MSITHAYSILYIDGYSNSLMFIMYFREHYFVHTACNQEEAFEILETYRIDLVIVDQWLAESNSIDLLKEIILKYPLIRSIFISSYSDPEVIQILRKDIGFTYSMYKPLNLHECHKIIEEMRIIP